MTTENRVSHIPVQAGQDLTPKACLHKVVTCNGVIASGVAMAAGLLKSQGASGEQVQVADTGIMKGYAGTAVNTVGYPVTVTTSGFIIAASSGGQTIGKAMGTAASGDLFPFLANFAVPGLYNG